MTHDADYERLPQPASWETRDSRTEERPASWHGKITCLINDCGWYAEVIGSYEEMHNQLRFRIDEHQRLRHSDGDDGS